MSAVPAVLRATRVPASLALWSVVGLAWLAIIAADGTGLAGALHHHTLLENGPPIALATGLFLCGWQVMVAAMMLPSSSATIVRHGLPAVAGYLVVWTLFGLACFTGDAVLHRLVDSTPWLASNGWLIPAGVLAGAGAYQFAPWKRRFLEACRAQAGDADHQSQPPLRAGVAHALDCVASSGPLMLLMFAAGFASLPWMVALSGLMFYEVRGSHAQGAARLSGAVLLWLALLTTMGGGVPGWAAA